MPTPPAPQPQFAVLVPPNTFVANPATPPADLPATATATTDASPVTTTTPTTATTTAPAPCSDPPAAIAKPAPTRRGRKRIRCDMANCTEVNCTHCTCKGECGRGHESGHCGNGRYGSRANCNQCKVAFYCLKKKKRAREAALVEAALVASGELVPPPPPVKKAKTTKRKAKSATKKPKAADKKKAAKDAIDAAQSMAPDLADDLFWANDDGMGSPESFLSGDDSATDFEDMWSTDCDMLSDTSSSNGSSCPTSPSEDFDSVPPFFVFDEDCIKAEEDEAPPAPATETEGKGGDSELLLFDFSDSADFGETTDLASWSELLC